MTLRFWRQWKMCERWQHALLLAFAEFNALTDCYLDEIEWQDARNILTSGLSADAERVVERRRWVSRHFRQMKARHPKLYWRCVMGWQMTRTGQERYRQTLARWSPECRGEGVIVG